MADWDKDEFMSKWDKTYVSTNLKDGASPYDSSFFQQLHGELSNNVGLQQMSSEILVSVTKRSSHVGNQHSEALRCRR